jgi:hypothetical protein
LKAVKGQIDFSHFAVCEAKVILHELLHALSADSYRHDNRRAKDRVIVSPSGAASIGRAASRAATRVVDARIAWPCSDPLTLFELGVTASELWTLRFILGAPCLFKKLLWNRER